MNPAAAQQDHKRLHGQFFTQGNPFVFDPFRQWMATAAPTEGEAILEPFAGANHIVRLMREAGYDHDWRCFDIDPPHTCAHGLPVEQCDTLAGFPEGYRVAITNPPYLARNSATRRGLGFPRTQYDDLYKHALDVMLRHVPYVAAIIPESFIVSGQFHHRLAATVSLTSRMFGDTDCPVCLALFVPEGKKPRSDDFELWDGNSHLGHYRHLASLVEPRAGHAGEAWKFNDPDGMLGLRGVDNTREASICFVPGETIASEEIKHSSRAISRISGVPKDINIEELVEAANATLARYRHDTHDMLMTAFKGLRKDGKYRRRLDFKMARHLLDACVNKIRQDRVGTSKP